MIPQERIRLAAQRIRDLSRHYAEHADWVETRFTSQADQWRYWAIDREIRGTEMAGWIATFSPVIAESLVAWLEGVLGEGHEPDGSAEAGGYDFCTHCRDWQYGNGVEWPCQPLRYASDFARSILGEEVAR